MIKTIVLVVIIKLNETHMFTEFTRTSCWDPRFYITLKHIQGICISYCFRNQLLGDKQESITTQGQWCNDIIMKFYSSDLDSNNGCHDESRTFVTTTSLFKEPIANKFFYFLSNVRL